VIASIASGNNDQKRSQTGPSPGRAWAALIKQSHIFTPSCRSFLPDQALACLRSFAEKCAAHVVEVSVSVKSFNR